jgi:hypothetical protein
MPQYFIVTPLFQMAKRDPKGLRHEWDLPSTKRSLGLRKNWDGTPAGQAARAFFKEELEFDYDDVGNDQVFQATDEPTVHYVPTARYYEPSHGNRYNTHWATVRITRDYVREQQEEAQQAAQEAQQRRDNLKVQQDTNRANAQAELADLQAQLDAAKLEREKREIQAKIDAAKWEAAQVSGAGAGPIPPGQADPLRTYELVAVLGGRAIPLPQALRAQARWFVTEKPTEGYGLAGSPGQWDAVSGGRPPSAFGLPVRLLGHDGGAPRIITNTWMVNHFGPDWAVGL